MTLGWHVRSAVLLRRLVALSCALVVVALAVCAASPELHHKLHSGDNDGAADTCVVAVFAAGVSVAIVAVTIAPPSARSREVLRNAAEEVFVTPPRYLRRPERGPPALS